MYTLGTRQNHMANEMHTTLPIEYQLKYGTARGNADLSDFVNQTPSLSFVRIESGLTHEVALSVRLSEARSV
jgi:hypothetical protein